MRCLLVVLLLVWFAAVVCAMLARQWSLVTLLFAAAWLVDRCITIDLEEE